LSYKNPVLNYTYRVMQRLIPTLFIVLALSPCANGSERLKYASATQKAEEIAYATNLLRSAIFTHSNRYNQPGNIKSQREARSYRIKTAAKGHTQKGQNPLNCFNSLAPDYCWYNGPVKIGYAQPAVDLESAYFENPTPVKEEVCSTINQTCDNLYNLTEVQAKDAADEVPTRQKKTISAGTQVKLDFFSISLIF